MATTAAEFNEFVRSFKDVLLLDKTINPVIVLEARDYFAARPGIISKSDVDYNELIVELTRFRDSKTARLRLLKMLDGIYLA